MENFSIFGKKQWESDGNLETEAFEDHKYFVVSYA
jgi:hypothetical protein